jgi:hypothetical protein
VKGGEGGFSVWEGWVEPDCGARVAFPNSKGSFVEENNAYGGPIAKQQGLW